MIVIQDLDYNNVTDFENQYREYLKDHIQNVNRSWNEFLKPSLLKNLEDFDLIEDDLTPDEDVSVDGEMHDAGDLDTSSDFDSGFEASSDSGSESSEGPADVSDEDSFTDDEYSSFEDEI